jgi:ADP-ribose pyrophosphatase YjhB (NUDIX family)
MAETITIIQKALVTNSKWQALVLKHPLSQGSKSLWDLPGGKLNFSESLRESLAKSVFRETGLNLTTVSIPLNVTTYLDITNRSEQIIRIIYLCLSQGVLNQNREMIWVDAVNFKQYDFPDEGYHQAFHNYLVHSRLSSEEFLGEGILEHTSNYLRQKKPSPYL